MVIDLNGKNAVFTITEETDPVEISQARERAAKYDSNYSWLVANAKEVFSHRGKYICIAGQELFVGDDIRQLLAQAHAAHPEDDAPLTQFIPKTRAARIYENRWSLEPV